MFDPVTIATATVLLLKPYFADAAKKFSEKVGEDAYAGTRKLIAWLRGNQAKDPEGDLRKALDRMEADPTGADNAAALQATLEKFLKTNPSLAGELAPLLTHATNVNANTIGDNNITAQGAGQNISININRH
jgi:hypothetical protein